MINLFSINHFVILEEILLSQLNRLKSNEIRVILKHLEEDSRKNVFPSSYIIIVSQVD